MTAQVINPDMSLISPLDKYRNRMFKPTSKNDLLYMLGGKVNIVTYDQISNYKTLKELLDPYQSCIILYPNPSDNPNEPAEVGHWCCLFIIPGTNRLEYFDSYGCYIDEKVGNFNEEDEGVIHGKKRMEPTLLKLIIDSDYADNTWWNETTFQSEKISVATCGLWCVCRLKNNFLTEKEFEKLYYDAPVNSNILPDLVVSTVICDMYPEM